MNIKKNRTIGIRTDDHFLRLLESASKMYNASKSEIIRSAVARTYGMNRPQFAGGSKVSMDGAYGKK